MATLKKELQDEAKQLATTIRDAIVKFTERTGMEAGIEVGWNTYLNLESDRSNVVVTEVAVKVGGMRVSA